MVAYDRISSSVGILAIAWWSPRDCVTIVHLSNIFLSALNIVFSIVVFLIVTLVRQIFVTEIIILLRLIMF